MAAHAKNHDYHLVNPSPWPAVGATSAFILAIGGILWMRDVTPWVFAIGAVGVLYTMYAWWSDVIKEATGGDHTPVVQMHHRYGMMLFIASEVMFFVAWFWAFFKHMLNNGVYLASQGFFVLSTAMTERDIDFVLEKSLEALRAMPAEAA